MKRYIITAIIVALAISITGCNTKTQQADTQQKKQPNQQSTTDAPNSNGFRQGFARPDLIGEVSNINGRDVTLKLVEMPQFRGNGQDAQAQEDRQKPRPSQEPEQGRSRRSVERKYTGESKSIKIPEGVAITSMVMGEKGREIKNVDLKDIKAGDTLQVWYDKDNGAISRITLSNFGGGGNRNNNSKPGGNKASEQ